MMKADKVKKASPATAKIDMSALWKESFADDDFRFEIRAQAVGVDLVRAIAESGMTQAEVAAKLGWKPSRVSRILHHAPNVTLRTLHDLAQALGLEFDVIYRSAHERRAPQPWEVGALLDDASIVCRQVNSLHENAQANLAKSEVILDTATRLVRRAWQFNRANVATKSVPLQEAA